MIWEIKYKKNHKTPWKKKRPSKKKGMTVFFQTNPRDFHWSVVTKKNRTFAHIKRKPFIGWQ